MTTYAVLRREEKLTVYLVEADNEEDARNEFEAYDPVYVKRLPQEVVYTYDSVDSVEIASPTTIDRCN